MMFSTRSLFHCSKGTTPDSAAPGVTGDVAQGDWIDVIHGDDPSYDATSDTVAKRIARLLLKAVHVERQSLFRVHIARCISRDRPEERSLHNAIKQTGQVHPGDAWTRKKNRTTNKSYQRRTKKWTEFPNKNSIGACSNDGSVITFTKLESEILRVAGQLYWNWNGYTRHMEDP